MKKLTILFLMLNLAGVSINAQTTPGLSMLIEDSVKILKEKNCNIINSKNKQDLTDNSRIKFKIVMINKSKFKPLFLFFVHGWDKGECPEFSNQDVSRQDSNLAIYQKSSSIGKDSVLIQKIWDAPIHDDTISDFLCHEILYSPGSHVLGNLGFSYIIEDETGQIVHKILQVSHVNYNLKGMRRFQREFDRTFVKEKKLSDEYINRCAKSKKILKKRTIKTNVLFRKIIKTPQISEYYCFRSETIYYITFYYTFYFYDSFTNHQLPDTLCIYDAINIDMKGREIESSQVFQGQIKSNRVKLIVK